MKLEIGLSVSAAVIGLALLGFLVFGPGYGTASMAIDSSGHQTMRQGTASMVEIGISGQAAIFLIGCAIALLLVPLGAALDLGGSRAGRWLMLAATAPLTLVSMISFVLVMLLPAVLLAAAATIVAFARPRRS